MTQDKPETGMAQELEAGIRRILAPNPSPMTYWGTNTYLVGSKGVAVIDPGPNSKSHFDAILGATNGGRMISHVVVTHAHVDHSEGANILADELGVPVVAFGPAEEGISPLMADLIAEGLESGGEGVDRSFSPDMVLKDREVLDGADWSLEAIWTPGHLSNHICLAFGDAVFSGDHVMDWATSIVSPPDGDLGAFMSSCERLLERSDRIFYPGHGNSVLDPKGRTHWLIDHRKERESQILSALKFGGRTPQQIVEVIYTDVPKALFGAAKRNVFAHLIDLTQRGLVSAQPKIASEAIYQLK